MKAQEHKKLKEYGEKLGREQLAIRIIEICKEVIACESYKGAIVRAGHIQALAIACGYDEYWKEKRDNGYCSELAIAERLIKR